jgi:hypothetical protein
VAGWTRSPSRRTTSTGQPDLLLRLTDSRPLGCFARRDVAGRPRPLWGGVAQPAPDHEEPPVLADVAGRHERASVRGELAELERRAVEQLEQERADVHRPRSSATRPRGLMARLRAF